MRTTDPRYPSDAFRSDGWPSRFVNYNDLLACGFSVAEARTLDLANPYARGGDPLVETNESIVGAKVTNGWPLMPHEAAWLARRGMALARERYARMERAQFLRNYPSNGVQIENWIKSGYEPTYVEFFGHDFDALKS